MSTTPRTSSGMGVGVLVAAAGLLWGLSGPAMGQSKIVLAKGPTKGDVPPLVVTAGPKAPSSPAVEVLAGGQVKFTWSDNSSDEVGFMIDRTPAFPEGTLIVGRDVTVFLDSPGRGEFSYRVAAYNDAGRSAATDPVTARVKKGTVGPHDGQPLVVNAGGGGSLGGTDGGGDLVAPPVPASFAVQMVGTRAELTWSDTGTASGFELQRALYTNGTWSLAQGYMLPGTARGYSDGVLTPGTYRYRVRALNAAGMSSFTNWAVGVVSNATSQLPTQGMPVMPPTAPSGLAVSDIGNGRAMATWADNSSDETGFKIERNPAFAGGAVTVTSNTTAYIDQCGPGDFSYRVSAVNDAGPSAWTPWAAVHIAGGGTTGPGPGDPGQTGSVGPDGWTIFNPSTDTRTVYVSSSMGSDGNDGLTEQHPKRTLAAAYELLRDGYPDWMLLKSGDTWHESMPTSWNKSGRSATEPIRIAQYGNGERPTLLSGTNCGIEWLALSPRQHIAITDLHLIGDGYTGSNNGIYGISLVGQWSDILVENCKIERYFVNASIQGQTDHWMTNIKVRRNVIVDAYRVGPESHSQGLFMAYCNGGLIEENVLDHNGWSETVPGADPTVFRHNVYVHPGYTSNMTERGNIVARGAASGLRSGGNVCEFNLCLKNPVNIVLAENSQVCRYNVVLDSRDILSSNPLGIGITAVAVNSEIYGNVVGYRTDADTWNLAGIQLQTGSHDSIIHNNVVYKWNGTSGRGSAVHLSGPMPGISIRNNVLNQAGGGHTIWCDPASSVAPSFVGNAYYSAYPRPFCTPQDQPIVEATYQQWLGVTGELGSNFGPVTLPQGERTIATYMQSLGMTPSLEAFLAEARNQSKTNWRREFTARAAGDYFREGFGVVVSMP